MSGDGKWVIAIMTFSGLQKSLIEPGQGFERQFRSISHHMLLQDYGDGKWIRPVFPWSLELATERSLRILTTLRYSAISVVESVFTSLRTRAAIRAC